MVKLADLLQDEINYICERISFSVARFYFQNYPKEFSKIKPGFRPEKLSDADTFAVLVKNSKKAFVASFLEKNIGDWLSQIQANCNLLEEEGYSAGEALLKTIPDSVFCDNIDLYFKLIEQDHNEDYLKLFRDALTLELKKSTVNDNDSSEKEMVSNSALLEEAEATIRQLRNEQELNMQTVAELEETINKTEEQVIIRQQKIEDINGRLEEAQASISEMKAELEHYKHLENYADEDFEQDAYGQFQYVSIGQIRRDNDGKIWVNRLADIVDGEIWPFFVDVDEPCYFANREKLYCKNATDVDNEIAVWNWRADPRDTDPLKDFITCELNRNAKFIEVIEFSQCKTLSDVAAVITGGFEKNFISEKVLFVCTTIAGAKEGLLCLPENLEYKSGKVHLAASVFKLPHYSIKASDIIKIGGICIYWKMNLGIPQSIFCVRTPYDAVKRMILSRTAISTLRDFDLSKREAQACRRFLESIHSQTLVQELADAYDCTEEEAGEYVEGFITHIDTYLSAKDLDMEILGKALGRNAELIALCKKQLSSEWQNENAEIIEKAMKELKDTETATKVKKDEIERLIQDKQKLLSDIERLCQQIAEKEQFAAEVESKIAGRIEDAKRNAADFISSMAFIAPVAIKDRPEIPSVAALHVFKSQMECEYCGDIDDIDTFEEELTENYMLLGYSEGVAVEMAQAVSFSICNRFPLVISENASVIGQCLAATIGGSELLELFISNQSIGFEPLIETIKAEDNKNQPVVFLLHGVFDGYSVNMFNAIVNLSRKWSSNIIMLLSSEGIPVHMIPVGVWNHAIYIDGDDGLQNRLSQPVHAFHLDVELKRRIDSEEYKEARKALRPFTTVLSNSQICVYAEYLSSYGLGLNDSQTILSQMVAAAHSSGMTEQLYSVFHDNGITNGERAIGVYL